MDYFFVSVQKMNGNGGGVKEPESFPDADFHFFTASRLIDLFFIGTH